MTLGELLSNIAAILVAITGLYLALSTRKKNLADATESISSATESMSNAAKTIIDLQEQERKNEKHDKIEAEDYAIYLLDGIRRLTNQLVKHKIKPSFIPKPINKYKKTS